MEWGVEYSHGGVLRLIDQAQLGNWQQVTDGGANNTYGSWSTQIASLGFSCQGLLLSWGLTVNNQSSFVDVGVDTSGGTSYQVIADQIFTSGHSTRLNDWFYIPVGVPAGSRIAIRNKTTSAGIDIRGALHPYYAGPWGRPSGSRVVSIGGNPSTTRGVQVDAGGTSNTYGSWTATGTTAPKDLCAICFKVGGGTNTVPTNTSFEVDLGLGATPDPIIQGFRFASGGTGDNYGPVPTFWMPCQIPAGTDIRMRAKSGTNDATDRLFDVVFYGLVK